MTQITVSNSYISDVVYGSKYDQYLNPLNLHYIALHAGLRQRRLAPEFSYCDLGCGDGTNLNIIASMYPDARFYGVDFNQKHISIARTKAESAGLRNVEYRQLDFSDLQAADFPRLDFISCFGTFSWINRRLQDAVLDFVHQSVADQGVFVVHYAAKPGKTQIDPLWHLIRVVTGQMAGNATERVRMGIKVVEALKGEGAQFFKDNPIALARSNTLGKQDLNYLAHETLSEWQAFHHSEIAERAHERGLQFAGLYAPLDNDPDFSIPDAFGPILRQCPDAVVRSTVEDYVLNRGIRTDVYVKATSRAVAGDITDQPVWLNNPGNDAVPAVKLPSGKEISFGTALYKAIAREMGSDVCSVKDLHNRPALSSYSEGEIAIAVAKLIASAQASPVIGSVLPALRKPAAGNVRPALKIVENILGSPIPTAGSIYFPSRLIGQCVLVDRPIALALSARLFQPDGSEQDWLAEQIRATNNQGDSTPMTPAQARNVAKRILALTTDEVVPMLVRLGIYA